jgi:PIN domain nuclease of toxin-antitoxin system
LIYVLDASAMLAYLNGEPGSVVVDRLLRDPQHDCYAHAINLCEVYYDFMRRADEPTAEQAIADLLSVGVNERDDLDPAIWREAGKLKAGRRLSLADALGLSLTQRLGAEFVTSDHHELDALASTAAYAILFIR